MRYWHVSDSKDKFVVVIVDDEIHDGGVTGADVFAGQLKSHLTKQHVSDGVFIHTVRPPATFENDLDGRIEEARFLEDASYRKYIGRLADDCVSAVSGSVGWFMCTDLNFYAHMHGGYDLLVELDRAHNQLAVACESALLFTKFPMQGDECRRKLENTVWADKTLVADRIQYRQEALQYIESLIRERR